MEADRSFSRAMLDTQPNDLRINCSGDCASEVIPRVTLSGCVTERRPFAEHPSRLGCFPCDTSRQAGDDQSRRDHGTANIVKLTMSPPIQIAPSLTPCMSPNDFLPSDPSPNKSDKQIGKLQRQGVDVASQGPSGRAIPGDSAAPRSERAQSASSERGPLCKTRKHHCWCQ